MEKWQYDLYLEGVRLCARTVQIQLPPLIDRPESYLSATTMMSNMTNNAIKNGVDELEIMNKIHEGTLSGLRIKSI